MREQFGNQTFDVTAAAALAWLRERAVERDAPSVLFALASEHLHTRTRCSFAPAGGRSALALLKERAGCVGVAELRREVERYRQ